MIDTQNIRAKIIDLAMRGQLSVQLAADGTAEDLLQVIQAEKQELIRDGKIKKEKPLPAIDMVPFQIPNGWGWVRWGDLSFQIQYGYNAPAQQTGRIRMVRITDIQNNKVVWNTVPYCDIDEQSIDEYRLEPNNILFARTGGTVGKSFLVEQVEEDAVFAGYLIRTSFSSSLSAKYMKYFMESRLYWKQLQDGTTATAQPNCNAKTLSKMLVPLPPLPEQQRIVERIEQTFSVLDTIDALQAQYADNLTVLKSKLIDAAIQGKLTEQLPEDGNATELLTRIELEKRALIASGKIPKEKNLPEITEEEIPFEIPESWRWVRVQDVASYITDYVANGSFATLKAHTQTYKEPNYALFVRTMDLSSDFKDQCSYIDKASYDFLQKSQLFGGELILPNIGASIGKAFIMPDMGMPMSLAPNSILLKFTEPFMNEYFSFVVKSTYGNKLLNKTQGGSATAKFSKTDLRALIVPLPPLAEQKRIVSRLKDLLPLCEI